MAGPTIDSPNPDNYFIGRGILYVAPLGTPFTSPPLSHGWRDVGNVPEFEITPNADKLDHYSARGGTRVKDRVVTITAGMTVRFIMEELTAQNLSLAMLGDADENAAGGPVIELLSDTQKSIALWLVGTSDIGARADVKLPRVDLAPKNGISFIGTDNWGNMEIEGDAVQYNGSFGTIQFTNVSDVLS